jgi:conjugative transfer pilus assembly protein TraH
MITKRLLIAVVTSLILPAQMACAGIGDDLQRFGFESNYTSPKAYESQAGGHYSGGSLFARTPVRDYQLMHVDLPSLRSGCGNIDIFSGALSFIKADRLIQMGKSIIADAPGYAFQLALETSVPQIKHTLDVVQSWANKLNQANMNSCAMAQDLVGGLWPKTAASQRQICKDLGSQDSNIFSDWAAAQQGCGKGGKADEVLDKASKDPRYAPRVVVNKNLIWSAIQKMGFLQSDDQLAEFFMTISGTLVFDKQGHMSKYPPQVNSRLIGAILYGGDANRVPIYTCKDTTKGCLIVDWNPSTGVAISEDDALVSKVTQILQDLDDKMRSDSAPTDQEKAFLSMISAPALKMIENNLMAGGVYNVSQYAEVISIDLLSRYLQQIIETVRASLTGTDYPPEIASELEQGINHAEILVGRLSTAANQRIANMNAMIDQQRDIEREALNNLSGELKGGENNA